ncbi:MAG: hypothetical protein ACOY93_11390 [Bacillota bacterium]
MNFWMWVLALVAASALVYFALSINGKTEHAGGHDDHGHGHDDHGHAHH